MAENSSFVANFKSNRSDKKKLKYLLRKSDAEKISNEILKNNNTETGFSIWSEILSLMKDEDKLFEVVKDVSDLFRRKSIS